MLQIWYEIRYRYAQCTSRSERISLWWWWWWLSIYNSALRKAPLLRYVTRCVVKRNVFSADRKDPMLSDGSRRWSGSRFQPSDLPRRMPDVRGNIAGHYREKITKIKKRLGLPQKIPPVWVIVREGHSRTWLTDRHRQTDRPTTSLGLYSSRPISLAFAAMRPNDNCKILLRSSRYVVDFTVTC